MNKMKTRSSIPKVVRFDYNKHLPQSSTDKTSDLFFILSSLFIAEKEQAEITQLILEKSLFKTTQTLAQENNSFLNTFFYINKLGPHNNIFYKYLEELEEAELIKKEVRNIFLTAKGLNTISELIETVSQNPLLLKVLVDLQTKIKYYSAHPSRTVTETHEQKVIDTTDKNKTKTIEDLIREVKPEKQFEKSSQFKYIDPFVDPSPRKISLPPQVLNKLENILAKVDEKDFGQEFPLESLFQ